MKSKMSSIHFSVALIALIATTCCKALDARVDPTSRALVNAKLQKTIQAVDPSCGSLDDVARRVEVCAKPLMDIIQGTVQKWPRTSEDGQALCNDFIGVERCVREVSRKCCRGVYKTIVSTLATSLARSRKRECLKAKLPDIVRMTTCIEKNQDTVQTWMRNVTGRLTTIETEMTSEKALNGVCCMVNDIEYEMRTILEPLCYDESKTLVRMYKAVLQDVVELVCRQSKCKDYLKGYKSKPMSDYNAIIAIVLRIVFSLDI